MPEKPAPYDPGPITAARRRAVRPEPPSPSDFPGCHTVRLKREDLDKWEGRRIEYWDGDTETALVMSEPTTDTHERPSSRLANRSALIAEARGAPIEFYGSMDLVLAGRRGERRRIMQADQALYLYPDRGLLPRGEGMRVGIHTHPDVVLEVDHTTDVRRGKLGLYEAWGFPELWVDVPDRDASSSRPWRWPGLTIHLLEDGTYRESAESRAFPGWTAGEIHGALNERSLSAATAAVLDRVGRALGERDGTAPDDSPWLRRHRDEGRAEGEARGREKERAAALEAVMRDILALRGIAPPAAPLDSAEWAGVTYGDAMGALRRCRDAADLRARLRRLRRR